MILELLTLSLQVANAKDKPEIIYKGTPCQIELAAEKSNGISSVTCVDSSFKPARSCNFTYFDDGRYKFTIITETSKQDGKTETRTRSSTDVKFTNPGVTTDTFAQVANEMMALHCADLDDKAQKVTTVTEDEIFAGSTCQYETASSGVFDLRCSRDARTDCNVKFVAQSPLSDDLLKGSIYSRGAKVQPKEEVTALKKDDVKTSLQTRLMSCLSESATTGSSRKRK